MSRWCITLCDRHNALKPEDYEARYYVLERIAVIMKHKLALLEHFLAAGELGADERSAGSCRDLAALDRDIVARTKRIMEAYEEAEWDDLLGIAWTALAIADASSRAERVPRAYKWLPQWAKDRFDGALADGIITGITVEALSDETVTAKEEDVLYRLYFDRERLEGERCLQSAPFGAEAEVTLDVAAWDRLPGEAVECTLHNPSKAPLTVKLPAGMIFAPSDAAYRRLVAGATVEVECAPGESKTFALPVYTIDGLKRALPAERPAGLAWSVCENPSEARRAAAVLAAAQRFSDEGRLAAAADPGRHSRDVTQVALWQYLRRIGDPAGWELFKTSLESRWALLPLESRPSSSEQGRIVEAIWNDARAIVTEVEKQSRK